MSVIKKMSLSGIRSFNPNDTKNQIIEFQTPLTIIVGVNGSGKTTIIEALKYAITNSFPPNCNLGSSFVNDPKLTNGYETMGVVKLEVVGANGSRIQTTRKVKVTVKDKLGKLSKKELDATITITDVKGVAREINSKCADVKMEMCRIMGVSEAILNNVILCHQEDSCWPLDEGKKVKEKFDAIFNTTMYIKCLDQLTKEDKEYGQRAKVENEKFNYVIENLQIARRKRNELDTKQIELQSVTDKIEGQQKELKEMETRLGQLREMEMEYIEIANKVAATKGKLEAIQKQVDELKSSIKEEFDGDIPSIEQALSEFNSDHRRKVTRQKQLQQNVEEKEEELKKSSTQQKNFLLEEGKFQQEETANKGRLEDMISIISDVVKLVKKLKEGSQDMSFSSSMDSCIDVCDADPRTLSPEVVVKALTSAIRARDSEINKLKTQYDKDEKELQKNIDQLRSKKASLETEIVIKNQQVKENTASIADFRNRLRAIEGSNAALEDLEFEEGKVTKEIESIQDSGTAEKYESEIKKFATEISEFESQISKSADDVELLSKDKGLIDQIEIYTNQKVQKMTESKKIMCRIEDDLKIVLGEIPEDNLEQTFDRKRESVITELCGKKNQQRDEEKKITVLQTELKRTKNDLEKKERKFEGYKDAIEDSLEGRDFNDVYDEVKERLEETEKENYHAEAAIFIKKKYIQKLSKGNCCPLCKRDLETKRQTQDLIQQIQGEIEKIKENDPSEKTLIEKLKTKLKDLLDLKPIWEENKKLEEEIPVLQEKVSNLKRELSEITEAMDDFNLILAELENSKSIFDKRSKEVHMIESAKHEIKQRVENIEKLESSRNPKAKELAETTNLSRVKTVLQDLKNSLKTKQIDRDNKSNLLNKTRMELNKLNVKKNEARQKILKITSELQNREALEVQKKDLEATNNQIQEASVLLKQELPTIKSQITEAEQAKSGFVEKKEKHMQGARQERDNLEKQKLRLADIDQKNEEFDRKRTQFVDVQKRAATCKRKVEELLSQKGELEKDLQSVSHSIATEESKKRNLEDNLNYKMKLKEVSKLKLELDKKQKLYESTHTRGVATERKELSQKYSEMFGQMNRLVGSRKETQTVIHDLKKELNERPYVNAENEYVEKLVKKTVYEKAQKDIRRYKTALDQAIMMFHRQRMESINRSLWEHWRRIYKGNDIDYIQIRTEAGSGKPSAAGAGQKVKIDTGKSRKTYNYRVVMIRRGTELDMRGRCSAGQRVLASIIIRIALADSFSSRCGVITLDEPTTNLDQKNINSLADALSGLAEKMSQQKNFQLIVITHDQEFTERLSSIDAVEMYWKISRDNMGFSIIEKKLKRG